MKTNYDLIMRDLISTLSVGEKPRLLLHSCCGPCSGATLEKLCPFFRVTLFYYNPNIAPFEEYRRRADEQRRLLREIPFEVPMLEGHWDDNTYYQAVKGLESEPEGGARCEKCFLLRLRATARAAAAEGFDYFTTTLTISPHKNADLVNAAGALAEKEAGVKFLPADFKKRDGYLRSLQISREHDLYRQDYCGCVYSLREKGGNEHGHTA